MGHSLTITFPARRAEMLGLEAGNLMKWEHLGGGTLRLKKR